jgi:hypothetical protein
LIAVTQALGPGAPEKSNATFICENVCDKFLIIRWSLVRILPRVQTCAPMPPRPVGFRARWILLDFASARGSNADETDFVQSHQTLDELDSPDG